MSDPDRRQTAAIALCALLSPLIRQLPTAAVRAVGGYAWLCCALAVLPVALLYLILRRILSRGAEGESLTDRICAAFGEVAGRGALLLAALWMLFYLGFVLRAGAERFVSAIYPSSGITPFIAVTALLVLSAGLKRYKVTVRCAEVVTPILLTVLGVSFLFVLPEIEAENLFPVTVPAATGLLRDSLSAADTLAIGLYAAFLPGDFSRGKRPRLFPRIVLLPALIALCLCAAVIGVFGAELAGELDYPFFVLLRSVRLSHLFERIEAVIIVQWVFTDFLLGALLLHAAVRCIRRVLGIRSARAGRALVCISLALSFAAAFLCADNAFALHSLAASLMPLGNAILLFGLPILTLIAEKLRGA